MSSWPNYQAEYIENRPLNKLPRGTAQFTQSSTDGRKEKDSNLYKLAIEKSGLLTGRLTLYIPGYLVHYKLAANVLSDNLNSVVVETMLTELGVQWIYHMKLRLQLKSGL